MTELRPWVWCLPFFGTQCRLFSRLGYINIWLYRTFSSCQ